MNPRLKKLQDEKAAVAVEKKVRKPRAKKTPIVEIPPTHDHCMQLNCKTTPKPLQKYHYFNHMNKAARRENGKIVELTSDVERI